VSGSSCSCGDQLGCTFCFVSPGHASMASSFTYAKRTAQLIRVAKWCACEDDQDPNYLALQHFNTPKLQRSNAPTLQHQARGGCSAQVKEEPAQRAGDTEQNTRPVPVACEYRVRCVGAKWLLRASTGPAAVERPAPGKKTQAGVEPRACCNSPFSYISIMMSDPPMNSPLT